MAIIIQPQGALVSRPQRNVRFVWKHVQTNNEIAELCGRDYKTTYLKPKKLQCAQLPSKSCSDTLNVNAQHHVEIPVMRNARKVCNNNQQPVTNSCVKCIAFIVWWTHTHTRTHTHVQTQLWHPASYVHDIFIIFLYGEPIFIHWWLPIRWL